MQKFFQTNESHSQVLCSVSSGSGHIVNYYVDSQGNLIADMLRNSQVERAISIKGIPSEWQTGLNDSHKRNNLKQLLTSDSYSTHLGFDVVVNPRILGGWGKRQHRGFWNFTHNTLRYFQNDAGEGTFIWKRDIEAMLAGFEFDDARGNKPKFKDPWDDAKEVADACNAVDSGDTNPVNHFDKDAQSWHFNVNDCKGGTINDSRIQHAADCLAIASKIAGIARGNNDAFKSTMLKMLGMGLHPLQDVFSHTDAFVQKYDRGQGQMPRYFFGHVNLNNFQASGNADIPTYLNDAEFSFLSAIQSDQKCGLSQRYSDAKTSTYLYLYLHHLLTGGAQNVNIEQILRGRLTDSLNTMNFQPNTLLSRGTHAIAAFLLAVRKSCDASSQQAIIYYIENLLKIFPKPFFNADNTDVTGPNILVRTTIIDDQKYGEIAKLWVNMFTISEREIDGPTDYSNLTL